MPVHDSSSAIDWRQSAKSQHIFVREREWEAAQTVWFWRDASANMSFKSGAVTKRARADLLLLALASLLVRGGERVGFAGMEGAPAASRLALTRIGRAMFAGKPQRALPPHVPFARGNQLVWFSDFLDEDVFEAMKRLSQRGVEGHLVRIVDPAEEDFPYSGRTRFESPRGERRRDVRPRRTHAQRLSRPLHRPWRSRSRARRHEAGLDLHRPSHRSRAAGCADRAACRHRRRPEA